MDKGVVNCPWWTRWYHRRLRKMDVENIWWKINNGARTTEEADRAWSLFKTMPGQEHWRCPCAESDITTKEGYSDTKPQ
jgi:hypothetical protein